MGNNDANYRCRVDSCLSVCGFGWMLSSGQKWLAEQLRLDSAAKGGYHFELI